LGSVPFYFFGEPAPFFGKLKPSGLGFDVPSGSGECQALLRQFAVLVRVFEKPVHSRRVKTDEPYFAFRRRLTLAGRAQRAQDAGAGAFSRLPRIKRHDHERFGFIRRVVLRSHFRNARAERKGKK
jgi:hypothetical protein